MYWRRFNFENLEHLPGKKHEKTIYFLSHKLSKTQSRWSTLEKEAYAIFYACEKLHTIIFDSDLTIKTDHMPLKYLLSSDIQNRKVALWTINISTYNPKIQYIKGSENILAYFMSRLPESDNDNVNDPTPSVVVRAYVVRVSLTFH